MEKMFAWILSILMMFSAVSNRPAAEEAPAGKPIYVRTIPHTVGTVLTTIDQDTKIEVIRTATVLGTDWVNIRCGEITGWVLADQMKVEPEEPTVIATPSAQQVIPAWAKWGIVNTPNLNIRKAPGVDKEKVGAYSYGNRVAILETNGDWGRTIHGWIYLGYVYMDGTVGEYTAKGVVTASRLNIRKGPGTQYAIAGAYYEGDKIQILEQFTYNGVTWGCTKDGWVCMSYVEPEEAAQEVIGYGIVNVDRLPIYSDATHTVGVVKKGDVVAIYSFETVDGVQWALIQKGWVRVSGLDLITDPSTEPEEGSGEEGSGEGSGTGTGPSEETPGGEEGTGTPGTGSEEGSSTPGTGSEEGSGGSTPGTGSEEGPGGSTPGTGSGETGTEGGEGPSSGEGPSGEEET